MKERRKDLWEISSVVLPETPPSPPFGSLFLNRSLSVHSAEPSVGKVTLSHFHPPAISWLKAWAALQSSGSSFLFVDEALTEGEIALLEMTAAKSRCLLDDTCEAAHNFPFSVYLYCRGCRKTNDFSSVVTAFRAERFWCVLSVLVRKWWDKTPLERHRTSLARDYVIGILQAAVCICMTLLWPYFATCHFKITL